jgi:hypothetical protein
MQFLFYHDKKCLLVSVNHSAFLDCAFELGSTDISFFFYHDLDSGLVLRCPEIEQLPVSD